MANVKLIFVAIMTILAIVMFITPLFVPERKNNSSNRIRIIVKVRLICFLIILVLLLLCLILR